MKSDTQNCDKCSNVFQCLGAWVTGWLGGWVGAWVGGGWVAGWVGGYVRAHQNIKYCTFY